MQAFHSVDSHHIFKLPEWRFSCRHCDIRAAAPYNCGMCQRPGSSEKCCLNRNEFTLETRTQVLSNL